MDIKELIKLQVVSQVGNSNNVDKGYKHILAQFVMFILLALLDDITKAIPVVYKDVKARIGCYFAQKVKETIEINYSIMAL